jgi:hypothetical protein
VATAYHDTTVQRGFGYYYYVTAYDDGSENWIFPGQSLESGKNYNVTLKASHPVLGPEREDVKNVRVVPNPYDSRSWPINYPGEPDKVLFMNLPAQATIKIYTATGDLVKTIEHTDGTGDEPWNLVTDSNQYLVTGIYLCVVEGKGEELSGAAIEKFVVIREKD